MSDHRSLSRRQFAQLGTASIAAASAVNSGGAHGQSGQTSDSSQIQPVGGQTIDTTSKKVSLAPPNKQPPNLKLPEVVEKKLGWVVVGLF